MLYQERFIDVTLVNSREQSISVSCAVYFESETACVYLDCETHFAESPRVGIH